MAKEPLSDRELIGKLGVPALTAAGYSEHRIKKWRMRGIPWKERAKIERLARQRRVKLPPDFAEHRVAT